MTLRRLVFALAIVSLLSFLLAGSVEAGRASAAEGDDMADTPDCAAKYEYDLLREGDILSFVRDRFDIPGRYEGDTVLYSRWSFKTCPAWEAANGKRVWCWFGLTDGLLYKWALRDIEVKSSVPDDVSSDARGGDWTDRDVTR